jgi:DNA-binding CsgD family transcriptional regulator
MRPCAEFNIQGRLCRVLPEDGFGPAPSIDVLGALVLDGKRYTIVRAGDAAPKSTEAAPKVIDLLTRRELEIAMLVSEGEGNKQVADRLQLSEWTVSTYLRRIYAKLGVRSRAAMVARVVAHDPR